MPAPVWLTGFEHGSQLTTSGGGLIDVIVGTIGTTIGVSSADKRTGTYSLLVSPTAAAGGRATKSWAGTTGLVARLYVKITSAPASGRAEIVCIPTSGNSPRLVIDQADGLWKIITSATPGTVIATGPTYSIGVWTRIDLKVDVSANPWVVYCEIDGSSFNGTSAQAAATIIGFGIGQGVTTGPAYTMYADDVIVSTTLGDYPIGPGVVIGLSPNADGTHNAGTNVMEDASGNDIGAVTAYNLLDDVPLSAGGVTDRVQQTANGAGNYAEVQFADLAVTPSAIHGVIGLLAYQSAATQANTGGCIASADAFATQTTIWGAAGALADYSESSAFYKSAIIAPPGGSWSTDEVGALRVRLGYSDDANPDPYWLALMFEVAYVPPSGTQYPQSVAGTVTTAGVLLAQAQKALAGTLTGAGVLLARAQKVLAGTLSLAGTVAKQTAKAFAGELTTSGALAAIKVAFQSVAGTLSQAGALVLQTGKSVAGVLTIAGMVAMQTGKALTGMLTTAGSLVLQTGKALAGTLTSAGGVAAQAQKALVGTLAPDGALTRQAAKLLAGTLASNGAVVTLYIPGTGTTYYQSAAGTLSFSGELVTVYTAAPVSGARVHVLREFVDIFDLAAAREMFLFPVRERDEQDLEAIAQWLLSR